MLLKCSHMVVTKPLAPPSQIIPEGEDPLKPY